MADNVAIKDFSGTSVSVASDQVTDATLGSVQVQYMKVMDGTLDSTNKLVVNSSGAASVVNNDVTATGSLAGANQAATLTGGGKSTAWVQVTGTFAGTLQFEGTVDGTNWFSVNAVVPTTNAIVTSATAVGNWQVDVSGLNSFRVRESAFTSGTAVVTIRACAGNGLVAIDAPLPTGTNTIGGVSLAQIGATTVVTGGVNGTLGVGGVTAAAATATGNPVRIGAIGRTTNPTAVTDGQVANIMTDKMGRQVVVQGHVRDLVGKQATTITSSTAATTVVTAGGASVFTDITSLTVTNGSATQTSVTLSDGTTSFVYNLPGGGGFTIPFNPPLPATTANTAWTLACGTSVASVYCNVVYVKNL